MPFGRTLALVRPAEFIRQARKAVVKPIIMLVASIVMAVLAARGQFTSIMGFPWVFGGAVLLDQSATGRIMSAWTIGTDIDSAIGLTYTGLEGAVLMIVELLVVAWALLGTLSRRALPRRVGLTVLVLWTSLWLANSIWMETLWNWRHPSMTSVIAGATVVVVVFAALRWKSAGAILSAP